jgi:putative ABC transport system permease protein
MIGVAFSMLFGDRAKYLMLIIGIALSTVLMVQGMALFCGLMSFSFATITNLRSPVWVSDPIVAQVGDNQPLRDTDTSRIRSVPGVAWAAPVYVGMAQARMLDGGVTKTVTLVGLDATTFSGAPTSFLEGSILQLREADSVIIDELNSKLFLARDGQHPLKVGDTFEMNDRTARVVGLCQAAPTMGGGSYIFTTYDRAVNYAPNQRKMLSFVLVQPDPGVDARELAARISVTTGLLARTEEAFIKDTISWMLKNSPIPFVVGMIVSIGFVVGTVISGQTFYTFVLENSRYFGALRAMGAEAAQLSRLILMQSVLVGMVGYGIGMGLIGVIFSMLPPGRAPLLLLWPVPVLALAAILMICAFAAFIGIRRIAALEPATVFRG